MNTDKMIWKGKEYILPPKTMEIARLMDSVDSSKNQYESYEGQWDFIKYILGDNSTVVLEADNIEAVDLVTLTLVYNTINYSYLKRVNEFNKKQQKEAMDMAGFAEIKEIANSVSTLDNVTKSTL